MFFCGDVSKASELVANGKLPPQDFSMFMGASTWDVSENSCISDALLLLQVLVLLILFTRRSCVLTFSSMKQKSAAVVRGPIPPLLAELEACPRGCHLLSPQGQSLLRLRIVLEVLC